MKRAGFAKCRLAAIISEDPRRLERWHLLLLTETFQLSVLKSCEKLGWRHQLLGWHLKSARLTEGLKVRRLRSARYENRSLADAHFFFSSLPRKKNKSNYMGLKGRNMSSWEPAEGRKDKMESFERKRQKLQRVAPAMTFRDRLSRFLMH